MFWFFGREACGIPVPRLGIEPSPPALEGEVLTTGPPGKSLHLLLQGFFFFFPQSSLSSYFIVHWLLSWPVAQLLFWVCFSLNSWVGFTVAHVFHFLGFFFPFYWVKSSNNVFLKGHMGTKLTCLKLSLFCPHVWFVFGFRMLYSKSFSLRTLKLCSTVF